MDKSSLCLMRDAFRSPSLGDDVEPCFEGASFFELQTSIDKVIKKIQEIEAIYTKMEEQRLWK